MQVIVGRIGRAHGIRGDVMVGVRTDEPELRFAVGSRLDTDPPAVGPLTVAARNWRSSESELIVRFEGIKDRTAAEALRGTWLTVDTATLGPPEDPDEFRDHDLIGLTARTVDGTVVGEVTDVFHYGQDLLVIKRASASDPSEGGPATDDTSGDDTSGDDTSGVGPASKGAAGPGPARAIPVPGAGSAAARAEILVPFVKSIVPEVDVAAGTLVIAPPPGLLDPDEAL